MNKLVRTALIVILVISVFVLVCNVLVEINSRGKTFDEVDDVPQYTYGLLLATSPITSTGAHNFYFDNRIEATDELYKAGKIRFVIASGGDYSKTQNIGCDEPVAIRDSLVARGIPSGRILLDYDGERTINSIIKAKNVYEIDSLVLISQKNHNQRAIYLAEHYNLKAIGYNARPSHIRRSRIKNNIREYLARTKMFLDIMFGRKPDYLHARLDSMRMMDKIRMISMVEMDKRAEVYEYFKYLSSVAGHNEQDTIVGNFTGHGIDTLYIETEPHQDGILEQDGIIVGAIL
jgi:SanA protein